MQSTKLIDVLVAALSLASMPIHAETTSGSIAGGVVDQQQSAVSGAAVGISEKAKGLLLTAKTDKEGRFVFPQPAPDQRR